jgi:2,3-bisphosphoglycerate-dependent phosphoglycerate mutase
VLILKLIMQLFFIRHAESDNNVMWTTTGSVAERHHDPDLSAKGQVQLPFLTAHIARTALTQPDHGTPPAPTGLGLTHLYCSLMARAIQTATPLAEATGLPLVAVTDLHEYGGIFQYGDNWSRHGLPGPTSAEIATRFPHLQLPADLPADDGWWQSRQESAADLLARARRVQEWLLARHGNRNDRVGFVSHGGFFAAFMAAVCGQDNPAHSDGLWPFSFRINNTGIAAFLYTDDKPVIEYVNRVDHLPPDLITW